MELQTLAQLGFGPFFSQQLDLESLSVVGRVVADAGALVQVRTADGLCAAHVGPRIEPHPVAGDWVTVDQRHDPFWVDRVLERRTALTRKQVGGATQAQALAANVDRILIVEALGDAVNLRRLERFLAAAWSVGAEPLVLLNKCDRADEPAELLALSVSEALNGVTVLALSAQTGDGIEALLDQLGVGETAVLLGPSGVGKSTLTNRLLGEERLATGAVRADDDKGRHTTTGRSLWALPNGALLIDSPGIRELALWDHSGIDAAFGEIGQLAGACRFRDCSHTGEPGCAVQQAVDSGSVDADRLANYQKLRREEAFLQRKQDERAAQQYRQEVRRRTKSYKQRQQLHRNNK